MKLVLLPGLDGTGNLFSAVLAELSEFECEVISLPAEGAQNASKQLVELFQQTIISLPPQLIKDRLKSIQMLSVDPEELYLPAAYIQASSDRLVPLAKVEDFKSRFKNLTIRSIEGPHFVLQSKPAEAAAVIAELVRLFSNQAES